MLSLLLALKFVACTPVQPLGIRFFSIPTTSMEPTLHLGAVAAVNRCAYGLSRYSYDGFELPLQGRWPPLMPARGDVIVFRLPSDPSTFFVKRVVGLPGDRIEWRGGVLLLNGAPVQQQARGQTTMPALDGGTAKMPSFEEVLPGGRKYVIVQSGVHATASLPASALVPAEHLYVVGDNRSNSFDSRFAGAAWGPAGTVPVDHVVGAVVASGNVPVDLSGLIQWLKF